MIEAIAIAIFGVVVWSVVVWCAGYMVGFGRGEDCGWQAALREIDRVVPETAQNYYGELYGTPLPKKGRQL